MHLAGYSGVIITIDKLEDIIAYLYDGKRKRQKYGKAARIDFYESMRQLIDAIDELEGFFFAFAGRKELLTDPRGIKSYEALWIRLSDEVHLPDTFNPYSDLVDLDHMLAVLSDDEKTKLANQLIKSLFSIFNKSFPQTKFHEPAPETVSTLVNLNPFNMRFAVQHIFSFFQRQL